MIVRGDEPERYRIDGMFGIYFSGSALLQLLGIAMIGSDEETSSRLENGWNEYGYGLVCRFHGLDGGLFISRVCDHVGIGVVYENEVIVSFFDGFDDGLGDFRGAHFGHFIEVGDDLGWNQDMILIGEWLFLSAIEEVGDVGVLFGFGDAKLFFSVFGKYFAEGVLDVFGRKSDIEREIPFVFGHGDEIDVEKFWSIEFVETWKDEGLGEFARAVFAEIVKNDGVFFLDESDGRAVFRDEARLDVFIGNFFAIALFHVAPDVFYIFAFAFDKHPVGFLDAIPVVIPIHRPIATDHARDGSDTSHLYETIDFLDVLDAGCRCGVATISETMDEDFLQALIFGEAEECEEMIFVRVYGS